MAHLQQTAKSFADNFTSTFLQSSRLAQDESQFAREQDFKNRQLRLGEAFRRDELDETISRNQTLSNYYDDLDDDRDATRDVRIQEGRNDLMFKGMFPLSPDEEIPEGRRTFEAFGDTYLSPTEFVEPERRATFGPIGSSGKFFGETQFEDGNVVGFDNVRPDPSISNRSNKPADISNEVGEANKYIEIFKEFERRGLSDTDKITVEINGETHEIDKSILRANAKRYTTDILNKVGIDSQGKYMEGIRTGAGVPIYGKNQWDTFSDQQKRDIRKNAEKARFNEIDKRRANGELTEEQFIALRYWAILGSK